MEGISTPWGTSLSPNLKVAIGSNPTTPGVGFGSSSATLAELNATIIPPKPSCMIRAHAYDILGPATHKSTSEMVIMSNTPHPVFVPKPRDAVPALGKRQS